MVRVDSCPVIRTATSDPHRADPPNGDFLAAQVVRGDRMDGALSRMNFSVAMVSSRTLPYFRPTASPVNRTELPL